MNSGTLAPPAAAAASRREFLRQLGCGAVALLFPGSAFAGPFRQLKSGGSLAFLAAELPVVPRRQWNRTPPNVWRLNRASGFSRITIHHAGTRVNRRTDRASIAEALNAILRTHCDQRYGDIGYHLIVDYAGRIWEGRSLLYEGAHVSGANTGNIGIMLIGNFEMQKASVAQLAAMEQTVALLRRRFGIPATRVFGHRDLGATVCPGRNLYGYVRDLRKA